MDATQDIRMDSFEIRRVLRKGPAHVWAAWADGSRKRRWMVGEGPGSFESDFRVGGEERSAFDSPMGRHENRTAFLEIAPERLIAFAYSMSLNGRIHSVSLATVTFEDEGGGTRLTYREQITTIGPSDDAGMRRHGWDELLGRIEPSLEVEPA
jgi:uncharacterized protein YndB with AHSA1/START domain